MKYNLWLASMAAAILVNASISRAQLPGLPPTAKVTATAAAQNQGNEVRRVPAPSTAIRGSLVKQAAMAAASMDANGQQGSDAQGRTGPVMSFIAVPSPQARRYKKNDLLTVIVREDSDSTTNASGNAEKKQQFDFAIQQFLQWAMSSSGIPYVTTVNNPSNLPEIKFKYENNRETDAEQERQDSLSARITAMIVDVKPNGTMVLEATKHIKVDSEEHRITLSGICRVEDVSVDNTILSTQLANLAVSKQTKGEVHDVNRRGWLNKWLDTWMPF